ncbi:ATP-dependent nuclease [Leuconostoc mesenteroides]|uniref:ATP-dependent nuclease n=1 Tax=Leuconostoc mesenteroides TaxID=1245 RepID=UPI00236133D7|nr:AAA family ATPase [Leuconostoc mesenteroides]
MGLSDFSLRIEKVKIKNFRGIRFAEFDMKENSVIVGQNNVGKSTIIAAISKFSQVTTTKSLQVSDFNIQLLKDIYKSVAENKFDLLQTKTNEEDWVMAVELKYRWRNLPEELMDFISELEEEGSVNVRTIVSLDLDRIQELKALTNAKKINEFFNIRFQIRANETEQWKDADSEVKKVMFPSNTKNVNAGKRLFYIKATRRVEDGDYSNNHLAGKIFNDNLRDAIGEKKFQDVFLDANKQITESLQPDLETMNDDLEDFSFPDDSLKDLQLLPDFDSWLKNPTLRLSEVIDELQIEIPLVSQGLGYQNIFNILSQLSVAFDELSKTHFASGAPRSSLFVIEEPEVYTHPQLQHIFIQNLIKYINKHRKSFDIQTLIISHSAEVAVSAIEKSNQFSLIRVSKINESLVVTNWEDINKGRLKSLILNYNSELLFAEKIILIEGDAERAIITSMMRRLDLLEKTNLLSQQIAIIPVGNSIKSLVESFQIMSFQKIVYFTDLDFARKEVSKDGKNRLAKALTFDEAELTTNSTIKEVFLKNGENFHDYFEKKEPYFSEFHPVFENLKVFTQGWIDSKFLPNTLEPAILNASPNNLASIDPDSKILPCTNDFSVNKVTFAFETADAIDEGGVEIPEYIKKGLEWLGKDEI